MGGESGGLSDEDIERLRQAAREAAAAYERLRPTIDLSALLPRFDVLRTIRPLVMPNVAVEVANALRAAVSNRKLAAQIVVPQFRIMDSVAEMFRSQQLAIESFADSIRTFQQNFDWARAFSVTAQFVEYLRRLRPAEWMLARRLQERGWWLVPDMDRDLVDALGEATDGGRRGRVGTLIVRHYTAGKAIKLSALVRGWNLPEFHENGRGVIFKQALRATRRGDYAIATTALTLQIEGIVKDFLYREQLIGLDVRRGGKSPVPLFATHAADEQEPSFPGFVRELEALYSHYAGPTGRRRQTNRHGQAHGGEVPSNGQADTVRAFLRLQTLHYHLSALRRRRTQKAAG